MFVFDWCGPVSRWAFRNRSTPVPIRLRRIGERRGRFLLLIKYAVLLLVLCVLAGKDPWYLVRMLAPKQSTLVAFAWGAAGGLLIFGFRRLLALAWRPIVFSEVNDYLLRGPTAVWLTIFAFGGFGEELWRALCIYSFRQSGYEALSAAVLPALAFSLAHVSGLPTRIPGGLEIAFAEAMTGLLLGLLFIWSGNLISPYLASVTYYSLNLYWLRHRFTLAKPNPTQPSLNS